MRSRSARDMEGEECALAPIADLWWQLQANCANSSAVLLSVPDVAQEIQAPLVFFRFLASLFGLSEIIFEIGPFDGQGQRV